MRGVRGIAAFAVFSAFTGVRGAFVAFVAFSAFIGFSLALCEASGISTGTPAFSSARVGSGVAAHVSGTPFGYHIATVNVFNAASRVSSYRFLALSGA